MDNNRKKELIQQYREMKTYYGVIQIRNKNNGKLFIEAVPNTKNRWAYYQLNLRNDFYKNSPLQKAWNEEGEEAFEFTVLWEKPTDKVDNMKSELKQLKKEWFDKLQPYGENGYNRPEEKERGR